MKARTGLSPWLPGWVALFTLTAVPAAATLCAQASVSAVAPPTEFHCGLHGPGQRLTAASRYGAEGAVAGFDLLPSPTQFTGGSCSADKPFFFSVTVPDGSYQVTAVLGSGVASVETVRAESRRLMVDREDVAAGGSRTVVFNVNVRTPQIAGSTGPDAEVRLKPREHGALDWDNKLTLEFNGVHPGFRRLEIRPLHDVPVLYLAGDSTVVDQDKEPWAAWGQMLPAFFGPGLVIANEAESGETMRSFQGERRWAKLYSTLRAGDFVMIQFAHNDQKNGTPEQTNFVGDLARAVDTIRAHGATPILVTSMNRRDFDPEGHIVDTLGGYPQAMRAFAAAHGVALIDLNAMSKVLFEAMGPDGTLKAFVHYPANTFPDQPAELKDNTHFNAYGAYELARAVVSSIEQQHLALARFLRPGIPPFSPDHPDAAGSFTWVPSPLVSTEKPYGN